MPKISQLATCVKTNWTVLFVFRFFSIVEDVERWALLSLVNNRARAARERPLRVAARSKQRHSIPGWFFWFLELWNRDKFGDKDQGLDLEIQEDNYGHCGAFLTFTDITRHRVTWVDIKDNKKIFVDISQKFGHSNIFQIYTSGHFGFFDSIWGLLS